MPRLSAHPPLPDPSSWASLSQHARTLVGHHAVQVQDDAGVHDDWLSARFVGIMALGADVAVGQLRLTRSGHAIRQDLTLMASDGVQTTWQQICTQDRGRIAVELVRLDPAAAHGRGYGRRSFRNFLLWCELTGVQHVELEAAKGVGGYYWARCGFLPQAAAWEQLISDLQSKVQRPGLSSLQRLVAAAKRAGPVGLAMLAASRHGKTLLLHAHWRGLLDLTNAEQLERARTYAHPNDPRR